MRSVPPAVLGVAAIIVFTLVFGATWFVAMREPARAPIAPSSQSEPGIEPALATPPPSLEETMAAADESDVLDDSASLDAADVDRRALALERAQATAGARAPEDDRSSARPEDRAASAKGLAIGERIGSHSAPRFRGTGSFQAVSANGTTVGRGGRTVTYAIEVENGLSIDRGAFASEVTKILSNNRSWIGSGRVQLRQVASPTSAQYTVRLASPATTDRICAQGGMTTEGIYSCRHDRNVMLNYYRWMTGAYEYPNALSSYRIYMVNHEFGHAIGHGHRECSAAGAAAPVMLQQSISSRGCTSQPWPLQSELAQQG